MSTRRSSTSSPTASRSSGLLCLSTRPTSPAATIVTGCQHVRRSGNFFGPLRRPPARVEQHHHRQPTARWSTLALRVLPLRREHRGAEQRARPGRRLASRRRSSTRLSRPRCRPASSTASARSAADSSIDPLATRRPRCGRGPRRASTARFPSSVGRHTLKFGGDYRQIGVDALLSGQTSGDYFFDRQFTQGPNPLVAGTNAGSRLASLLLGVPVRRSGFGEHDSGHDAAGACSSATTRGYAQDDFRVAPNFTLNYGSALRARGGPRGAAGSVHGRLRPDTPSARSAASHRPGSARRASLRRAGRLSDVARRSVERPGSRRASARSGR